ncbi:MAG: DUF1343 domain-containing protein [Bacteroidetes bacterium]|nr:DUF1343 domain-containing protein [Bacteroidota bacterium]
MCFYGKNTKIIGFTGLLLFLFIPFQSQQNPIIKDFASVVCGNKQFDIYLPLLKNKRVGIITNITGVVGPTSIVDTLLALNVTIKKIFGPEHGFRSDTDAGEKVNSNTDVKTGLPIISLYGSNKKPSKEQLEDIDVLLYDIQDIGVRFYTYISTMCYAMEACAENNKEFIVLDRPNPNGFYIDGPVLENKFKGFLGLHNVPLVYGMTCGEYATMANGEGWLKGKVKCKLTVIPLKNYDRNCSYYLPVRPSPNIPDYGAVLLYPSLGLFEGTIASLGRGTDNPFKVVGFPGYKDTSFCFTPYPTEISKNPKYKNESCCGLDLRNDKYITHHPHCLNLQWLRQMMQSYDKEDFFDKNFNYHAGNAELQVQLKTGMPINEIRNHWQAGIKIFKKTRKKYLLYPDFN